MTQEMDVTRVGDFVFSVWDDNDDTQLIDKWPCSSVKITLALNSLTSATVVIGCGRVLGNIEDTMDHSAELLMKEVASRSEMNASMVNCTIHEVYGDQSTLIFKGVIVGATLVYKAGSTTNRAIRLECLNKACYLHIVPMGITRYLCGSYVINEMTGHDVPPATWYGDLYSRSVNVMSLCTLLTSKISGDADIATRISYLVEGIVALSGAEPGTTISDDMHELNLINFGDYITCDYTINKDLYMKYPGANLTGGEQNANSNTNDSRFNTIDSNFNYELGMHLLDRLQNSSVLEAVLSLVTTTEYMMSMVPRLNGDMKLQPSRAWSKDVKRTLTFADLKSINSNVSPLAHIADPDVFIVNYSAALPMDGSVKIAGSPVALTGVYTKHADLMEERRKFYMDSNRNMDTLFATTPYKRRVYDAPTWLNDSFIGNTIIQTQADGDKEQPQRSELTPPINHPKKEEAAAKDEPYLDCTDGMKLADELAKALFTFIHGRANTAELELVPSIRFGMNSESPALEDLIGELIDIRASENMDEELTRNTDDLLELRGMVTSVSFSYDAGRSASCSYSMQLTRVRPLNEEEDALECPLYAPVKKSK